MSGIGLISASATQQFAGVPAAFPDSMSLAKSTGAQGHLDGASFGWIRKAISESQRREF
jgi:hypothetical protein